MSLSVLIADVKVLGVLRASELLLTLTVKKKNTFKCHLSEIRPNLPADNCFNCQAKNLLPKHFSQCISNKFVWTFLPYHLCLSMSF